jgi:hypothetical protein
MDISFTNNNILTQASRAFNIFEGCQIPFTAVKLNVQLQDLSKKEIDTIVEKNFRSEKDLIFKEDENYIILMKRTTIEEAERAVIRLKGEIGSETKMLKSLKDNLHYKVSAYIFGSIKGTKRMQVKYLNLIPNQNCFDRNNHKISFGYGEYLKFREFPKTENFKINKMINLVI